MNDDTDIPSGGTGPYYTAELFDSMGRLTDFQVLREKARKSMQQLWLIQVDDTSADPARAELGKNDCPEDDRDVKLHDDHATASGAEKGTSQDEDEPKSTCEHCKHLPSFTPGENRRFKLVQSTCPHFAAVSYCWPKHPDGSPKVTLQTYEFSKSFADGKIESTNQRPPDDVVDRAIEFAQASGLRQLWIDVVCLPQDNSEEHQLGIQAIDLVYQRAQASVGLLECIISEQRLADALCAPVLWNKTRTKPHEDLEMAKDLVEVMTMIVEDQFHTRAWIFQEVMSAEPEMILVARIGPDVNFPSAPGPVPHCWSLPATTLLSFGAMIQAYLHKMFPDRPPSPELIQGTKDMIRKLHNIHPIPPSQVTTSLDAFRVIGGANFGGVSKLTAATALRYLRQRKNTPCADRLAVMANLCDYDVRIDTVEAAKSPSLVAALVAQALKNGDLSLLNPDLYASARGTESTHFGWCPPFRDLLRFIKSDWTRPGASLCPRNPIIYHLSDRGFKCPATMWQVEERVDCQAVRERWLPHWKTLWSFDLICHRDDEESPDDFDRRTAWISDYAQSLNLEVYMQDEVLQQHATLRRILDARVASMMVPLVLTDILQHLYHAGNASLADSIWLSVRNDQYETSNPAGLPDDVESVLRDPQLLNDARNLFALDWNDSGEFYQIWLLDRVMRDGAFWCGSAHAGPPHDPSATRPAPGSDPSPPPSEAQRSDAPAPPPSLHPSDPNNATLRSRALKRKLTQHLFRSMPRDDTGPAFSMANVTDALWALVAPAMGLDSSSYDLRGRVAPFDVDGPALIGIPFDPALEMLPRPVERAMRVCWVLEHDPEPGLGLGERVEMRKVERKEEVKEAEGGEDDDRGGREDGRRWARAGQPPHREGAVLNRDCYRVTGKVKGMWPFLELMPSFGYLFR